MDFSATLQLSTLDGSNGFQLGGDGQVATSAGDIDGDGYADLVIGVASADPNGKTDSGAGTDGLDGGPGSRTADYTGSSGGVTINLQSGSGSGGDAEGDTLIGIENVIGSGGNDNLRGNSAANLLAGNQGNDHLFGAAGQDKRWAEPELHRILGDVRFAGGDREAAAQQYETAIAIARSHKPLSLEQRALSSLEGLRIS